MPASCQPRPHVYARPIRRILNRSVRSGRPEEASARGNACSRPTDSGSSASRPRARNQRGQQTVELLAQGRKFNLGCIGLEMYHDVECGQRITMRPPAEGLPNPTLQAMPSNRLPRLATGGDAQPRFPMLVAMNVEDRPPAVASFARPIAARELPAIPEAILRSQALVGSGHAPRSDRPSSPRPTGACGPCDDGGPTRRDLVWCACATESHASSYDGDCSAEMYASRRSTLSSIDEFSIRAPAPARNHRGWLVESATARNGCRTL